MTLKIAVACGGTGGHIFPGLATAEILRGHGHDVTLWLAGKDIESAAVKGWGGRIVTVYAEGLPSGISLRTIRSVWKLVRAIGACRQIMEADGPDVLLAMGSYASVGPAGAALLCRIPVVLHEANVLPGRAVSLFSRWAAAVAGSFEETRFYLRRKDIVVTGMPLRKDLEDAARGGAGVRQHDLFTILVMGGSRGAHKLNEVASEAIIRLSRSGHGVRVIHLAGVADEQAMKSAYDGAGVPSVVHGFISGMEAIYPEADLAICRSGAATCAELSAFSVPALLVPYPFAAKDHQAYNARALEKLGAADVVPEADLTVNWLVDYILGCMRAPSRLARMSAAAKSRALKSAAVSLAELVEQTGRAGRADHQS